jgi:uncharacterized protein DUF397
MDLNWRKSSFTNPTDCVELAWPPGAAAVRDSKDTAGPILRFDRVALTTFIADLKGRALS